MRFWVDDRLVPASQAKVSVLDRGFTVADGVFETLRTTVTASSEVVPFAASRHCDRLARSARFMGLPEPDPEMVMVAMLAVCAANPDELAGGGRLRVTFTSGEGGPGTDRSEAAAPTLVVTAAPARRWGPTETLAMSPWPRNERSPVAGLKTTSYAENVVMLAAARALGAGEALLSNLAGELCEGTGSNLFLVLPDGPMAGIVTPAIACGPLAGITRGLVLQWGWEAGLPVAEGRLRRSDLLRATGCFVTSSTRDVQRVDRVLDAQGREVVRFPPPTPGDIVEVIAVEFAQRAKADANP